MLLLLPVDGANAAGNSVASQWKDSKGRNIVLYQGTYDSSSKSGFGWAKITTKHAITRYSTVKFPTSNPNGGTAQGTQRLYQAWAQRWQAINGRWTLTAEVEVRTVIETATKKLYYGIKLNGSPGVLTTYCVNANSANACPSWVDTALANGSGPRGAVSSRDAPDALSSKLAPALTASYQPLTP